MIELPKVIDDNSLQYIRWIGVICEYACPDSDISIRRNSSGFIVNIMPSEPEFRQDLIRNLLFIHRHLGQKIKFSSSLERQKSVSFTIELPELLN